MVAKMEGILILAHGSREKQTEKTFEAVVSMVREKISKPLIIAYMEFSQQNIEKGLDQLVEHGVTSVRVVPYFLFSGIHIREDIPNELSAYTEKHPDIQITMADTLGADPRLADILVDRILG